MCKESSSNNSVGDGVDGTYRDAVSVFVVVDDNVGLDLRASLCITGGIKDIGGCCSKALLGISSVLGLGKPTYLPLCSELGGVLRPNADV